MANTRQSAKRSRVEDKRRSRNIQNRSLMKTAVKKAIDAVKGQDMALAKDAYLTAVKALDKAASKGAIPKLRASRKISRLTKFAQKTLPGLAAKTK